MDIKISALRVFVAVVEEGGIQSAGNRVNLSPSAVSMTLKQIEDCLGGDLFEFGRKQVLTELGRYLLDLARDELAHYARTMIALKSFAQGDTGKLDIACVPSVALNMLPWVIQVFRSHWPNVTMDIRDADTRSVTQAVANGQADIGIAGRPSDGLDLDFELLFRDEVVLVCPAGKMGRKGRRSVSWEEIRQFGLIANGLSLAIKSPKAVELHAEARLMVRNTTSLIAMVKNGIGVTLLPRMAIPDNVDGVELFSVRGTNPTREVGLIHRAGSSRSPVCNNFTKVLREYVSERVA